MVCFYSYWKKKLHLSPVIITWKRISTVLTYNNNNNSNKLEFHFLSDTYRHIFLMGNGGRLGEEEGEEQDRRKEGRRSFWKTLWIFKKLQIFRLCLNNFFVLLFIWTWNGIIVKNRVCSIEADEITVEKEEEEKNFFSFK